MDWQPERDPASGITPDAVPVFPGEPLRDPRLSGFTKDGMWDACPPSAALAAALEGASAGEWRCPGASRDEMLGLLRQWQAMEAWAAAGKLGVLRALIRDDDQPLPGGGYQGDLPEGWTKALTHEVALALSMPAVSADPLMWTAWNLQAMLPGTGALLASGQLTMAKARAVEQALSQLTPDDAAAAEAMIIPDLPGKTYGQAQRLAVQAAITVDPDSATRRRQHAEQDRCRVTMFREESGAAALSGRDLPTDQTLAAHASVCARAEEYKQSGGFPDDTRMDQFRVTAYLDLLNEIPAATRIASGRLSTVTQDPQTPGAVSDGEEPESGSTTPPPRLANLVLPLATLLGLAERPGEGHALGPLDPDLCRSLAACAADSPWSQWCATITDPDGIAIGHGCASTARHLKRNARPSVPPDNATTWSLPARANLTVTATQLARLTQQPPGPLTPWRFTRVSDSGPPGGFGTWTLTLPDGRNLTVRLGPVPTSSCDHRHESHAYQPNDTLRHLVQVRDYECTFPTCSRHARESDFEHAVPYDQGGRTCACNAGARSRACHQVKQSPGWTVTQPRPGWHQWETPAGRVYTQAPKRYPD